MRLATLAIFLISAMPVHATIITVNASDFAANSPIAGIGATFSIFSNEDGSVGHEPLFARDGFFTSAGSNRPPGSVPSQFGGMLDAGPCLVNQGCVGDYFSMLRVDFDALTDYVSMRAVEFDRTDPGAMWAFRRDGSLVASCHFFGARSQVTTPLYSTAIFGPFSGPCGSTQLFGCDESDPSGCSNSYNNIAITTNSPEIAYVLFGGYAQSWNRHSADQIRYSVPEPSALTMFCLGVFGSFDSRRRQRDAGK